MYDDIVVAMARLWGEYERLDLYPKSTKFEFGLARFLQSFSTEAMSDVLVIWAKEYDAIWLHTGHKPDLGVFFNDKAETMFDNYID